MANQFTRELRPHGTTAAARRHYRRGESVLDCPPCRNAAVQAQRERDGADPYSSKASDPAPAAARNGLPIVPYRWRERSYPWASAQLRRAEEQYGTPSKTPAQIRAAKKAGKPARAQPRKDTGEMTAQQETAWPDPAGELGFSDAARQVAAMYAGGVSLDEIAARQHDTSASLLSDAQTAPGRAYADGFAWTSESLIADLRADEAAAALARPAPGTPHPDRPGWESCHNDCGVYVRSPQAADREAC